jgi:hypothetical protein
MKTIVRLYGGLGNQLFQYIYGLYVSHLSDSKLVIDDSWLNHSNSRSTDILDFQLLGNVDKDPIESFQILRILQPLIRRSELTRNLLSIDFPNEPGYLERDLSTVGEKLFGYYQSYLYYEACKENELIPESFWSLRTPSKKYIKIKEELEKYSFTGIHIRGGDYINNPKYANLTLKYYQEALERISLNHEIIVFSDDPQYVRQNFQTFSSNRILSSHDCTAPETLLLMTLGQGLVMANSTFSFWSGMINKNQKVIAPSRWFANEKHPNKLFPSNWEIL